MVVGGKCIPQFTGLFTHCSLISSFLQGCESDSLCGCWVGTYLGKDHCYLPELLEVPSSSPSSASARSESTAPESWEMLIAVICWVTGLGELGLTSPQQQQQQQQQNSLNHTSIIFSFRNKITIEDYNTFCSKCLAERFVYILLDSNVSKPRSSCCHPVLLTRYLCENRVNTIKTIK